MQNLFLTLIALSASLALANPGNVVVTQKQLFQLKQVAHQLHVQLNQVLKDNDDPEVIPRARDRRVFREAMQSSIASLAGNSGVNAWIENVKTGPVPQPPTPPQPPVPTFKKIEIKGFFVVGKEDSKDYAKASNSHQAECTQAQAFLTSLVGNNFDSFNCGSTSNISQYGNIQYFQLSSSPSVTLRIHSQINIQNVNGGNISGTVDQKDPHGPYISWWNACKQWMSSQQNSYGVRFLAASCGDVQNVSRYANIGYKQYASQGTVYLKERN